MPPVQPRGEFVRSVFSSIAGRYDLANHLLSGGLDFFWRRRAGALIESWEPTRILDLATGSGDLALTLRAKCPGSLIVGADFCHPMLLVAQGKRATNLVVADGLQLPFAEGTFDVVTIAFGLRNMESWERGLAEILRVLRPGGHVLILDFSLPPPPLRWVYRPYLHHLLPRIAALLTRDKAAYDYLGDSIETFPHGQSMCALVESQGFSAAKCERLSGGIVSLYSAERRASLSSTAGESAMPESV